jgi:uncharacterized lipoprotein YddW (UPF0748 family)
MARFERLWRHGLAILAGSLMQPTLAAPQELRGVWLTANDMPVLRDRSSMQATVNQLADLQFNRLYVVVWNGGMAYYPSQISEGRGFQNFSYRGLQGQDVIGELIAAGRSRELAVLPWFEFGFMAPPDSEIAKRHRAWLTQRRDGTLTSISAAGEVVWLNPFRPEVQKLITELVVEVIKQYNADGIQFDDHMSLPRDFGYDPFTVELYRKETGKQPPANPDDPGWVKWRADRLTSFMARLSKSVREAQPNAIISVSPNYYDFAYKLQLQDWRSWVKQGIADELLIQIYRSDLDSYLPQLTKPEVQESSQRIPTAIAVLSGQRNRPTPMSLIREKVEANRAQGLGAAFFYLESLWKLGPEPEQERITALGELLKQPTTQGPSTSSSPSPPAPPAPPPLP